MNTEILAIVGFCGLCAMFIYGCKKDTQPVDNCASILVTLNATNTIPCATASGTITVNATGSTGFTYSNNGGTFQSGNVFSGLASGNYTINVKDANGCTKSGTITITNAAPGVNFTNVKNIISSSCADCHLGVNTEGNVNFNDDCSIVADWNRINGSCVQPYSASLVPMPYLMNPLTTSAQNQITAWINAGHKYSD
jgi:hypothetical protein